MAAMRRTRLVGSVVLAMVLLAGFVTPAGAIVITPTKSISGVITDADTGQPIEGVGVWLEKDGPIGTACFQQTVTGPDGTYAFLGLPSGYTYRVVVPDPEGYTPYESEPIDYAGTPLVHDVSLAPVSLAVAGTVTLEGAPATGVKVKVWRITAEGCEEWLDYLWTESDGAYAFYTDKVFEAGTYFITVYDGCYQLVFTTDQFEFDGQTPVALDIELAEGPGRIADDTRFSTAVKVARSQFDPAGDGTWPGVTDVVLACGDDRAAADPLSAAGLCGALEAPLFLTSGAFLPAEVKQAVKEIADANGTITVHVVGGKVSVPQARLDELAAYVGEGRLVFERIDGVSRYATAAEVAAKIAAQTGGCDVVLVANGADPTKYFDALALSPLAAAKGFPVLLVSAGAVPGETTAALAALAPSRVIVGGGSATVSESVRTKLGAERWAGSSRYSTAITVADRSAAEGWLSPANVGVAAKLPDALSGGGFCGMSGGVLLLTDGKSLSPATAAWLEEHDTQVEKCVVFGGTRSLTEGVRGQIGATLALSLDEQK